MDDIFDKILQSDLKRQELIAQKEEQQRLFLLKSQCGSCDKWMGLECPREKTKKVKCSDSKCSKFKSNDILAITLFS